MTSLTHAGLAAMPVASSERITIAGVTAAIALIYANIPTVGVQFHGLPSALNFVAPAMLAGLATWAVLLNGASIRLTVAAPWLCMFLTVGFVSALQARDPSSAMDELISMLIEGVFLFIVVVNAVRTSEALNAALWAIICSAGFMSAVVLHQYGTGAFEQNYGGFGQLGSLIGHETIELEARLAGSIGEVNRFAQVLAMAIPIAIVKALTSPTLRLRVFAGVCAFAMLGGCGVTFSRGVLVGLVPVIFIAMILGYIKVRSLVIGALIVSLAVVAVPSYRDRLVGLSDTLVNALSDDGLRSSDGAIKGRFASVAASLLVFVDNPIIGVGPGQNLRYYQQYSLRVGGKLRPYPREAHSLIPQLLADWGLLGVTGFLGAIATICAGLLGGIQRLKEQANPNHHIQAALLLSLVAYGGTSVFLHFSYVRYFWLMLGLAAAAAMLTAVVKKQATHSNKPLAPFSDVDYQGATQ